MAGRRGTGGRPPKPHELRVADGTHRSDRHGKPEDAIAIDEAPERPEFGNPHAATLWDDTVAQLITLGVAKSTDAAMLRSMCELWGLYRSAYEIAESHPIDKDARIAVVAYWAKFEQAAARFGMNASDRGRLKVEKAKKSVRRRNA